jgi:putative addiction module component (TIGR02574 family)
MKIADHLNEAASLPLEKRVKLVDSLLQTLNPVDDSVDAEWLAVAQRRLEDIDSGRIQAIPGEEVFEKVRRLLAQ